MHHWIKIMMILLVAAVPAPVIAGDGVSVGDRAPDFTLTDTAAPRIMIFFRLVRVLSFSSS